MSGILFLSHRRFDAIQRCVLFYLNGFQRLVFFCLCSLPFLVLLDLPFAVVEILIHRLSPLKSSWRIEYIQQTEVELILNSRRLRHNR